MTTVDLKSEMMTVTITGKYPSVTITSNPRYRLVGSKTDTVRRVRPKGKALLYALTNFEAWSRLTTDGYYSIDYGDYQRIAPVGEYLSTTGTYLAVDPAAEASLRLRSKIKSQNINLAQSLSEYKQTANMVVSLMADISFHYRSIRAGLPAFFSNAFSRLLKQRDPAALRAANRWLQYQYGLRPLMSDIYGSVDLLRSKLNSGITVSASCSGRNSLDQQGYNWGPPSFLKSYQKGLQSWHAKAYYTVTDNSVKKLSEVGITNPLALAWELIPYSFCVDWVLPVGKYLSSLDALNGVSLDLAYLVTREKWTITGHYYSGTQVSETTRYSRRRISCAAIPYFAYKPSGSHTALVNGMALLTQLFYGNTVRR